MAFVDYIERLQQKSERERIMIAFGTSAAVTALVALIWVGTLVAGRGVGGTGQVASPALNQFGEQVQQAGQEFGNLYNESKTLFGTQTTVEPTQTEETVVDLEALEYFGVENGSF